MAKEGLTGLHSVVQYKTFFDYIRQDLTSSYSTFLVVGTRESRHSCFLCQSFGVNRLSRSPQSYHNMGFVCFRMFSYAIVCSLRVHDFP